MSEYSPLLQNSHSSNDILSRGRRLVYASTFVAYAMFHFSRKCYTNIKVELKAIGINPILLSQMDTAFMFCYAVGSFFSGQLGDRFHAPSVVACGLFGSALCVLSLAIGIWSDIEALSYSTYYSYFMGSWLLHGFFQSIGGPVGTAIMGFWFGSKDRGWVFGTWTCHQYVGNITAALVTTFILRTRLSWTWALVFPVFCNFAWGVWMWTVVPEKPADFGIITESPVNGNQRNNEVYLLCHKVFKCLITIYLCRRYCQRYLFLMQSGYRMC